jgi:hypothetical protein
MTAAFRLTMEYSGRKPPSRFECGICRVHGSWASAQALAARVHA